MIKTNIRSVNKTDIPTLVDLDPSYHTEYGWQLDIDNHEKDMNIRFREMRLPRSMLVEYPNQLNALSDHSEQYLNMLVSEFEDMPIAFIGLSQSHPLGLLAVTDLVVKRRFRRAGIATSLLRAAQSWAVKIGKDHLVVEMQSKNYPAIQLVSKLGFEFSGYSDKYYPNQDIALFFTKRI